MKGTKALGKLSDKQALFVSEYIATFNARQAAKNAGYSTPPLKDPKVRAAIRAKLSDRFAANDITSERVLREVASIAFANVSDVMALSTSEAGGQMLRILDTDLWPREVHAAVAAIEQTLDGEIKIKTRDKMKALEMLAKHLHLLGEDDREADTVHVVVVPERCDSEAAWQGKATRARGQSEKRMRQTLGDGSSGSRKPDRSPSS